MTFLLVVVPLAAMAFAAYVALNLDEDPRRH